MDSSYKSIPPLRRWYTFVMKKCFRCEQHLPSSAFSKNVKRHDGLQSDCKACVKSHAKTYEVDISVTHKACFRCKEVRPVDHYRVDRSKKDGRTAACKDCLGVANPRSVVPRDIEYTAVTKQCGLCRNTFRHGEFHKSTKSKTGLSHICKSCARVKIRLWAESNPDKKRRNWQEYRARKVSVVQAPLNDFADILEFFGGKCMHPDCSESNSLTLDHVTPLIKGGVHCNTNFQVLCKSHNSSKGASLADYRGGRILVAVIK